MDESLNCSLCGAETRAEFMMDFGLCPTCYAKLKSYMTVLSQRIEESDEAEDGDKYLYISKLAQLLKSLCECKLEFADRGVKLFGDIEDYIEETVTRISEALEE